MTTKNEDATTIGVRISKDLYDRIEEFWRLNLYESRSDFVMTAINNLLDGEKCIHCGAVNPKGSHMCGVCLRPIKDEDTMASILRLIACNQKELDEFERNEWD